jgi:vancomycin permeability regulator SanA
MTRIKSDKKGKKIFLRILLIIFVLGVVGLFCLALMNNYVIGSTQDSVYSLEEFEASNNTHYEAVIVLGCAVWDSGPSPMLADRLRTAASVFKTGCADYILVTGDSEHPEKYDEIGAMTKFLTGLGISEDDIVCDPLGLSTYESMLRAVKEFNIKSAVVVTTGFHCARSVYDARRFGIESVGVAAINSGYVIKQYNYYREFIARGKDYVFTIFKPGY